MPNPTMVQPPYAIGISLHARGFSGLTHVEKKKSSVLILENEVVFRAETKMTMVWISRFWAWQTRYINQQLISIV